MKIPSLLILAFIGSVTLIFTSCTSFEEGTFEGLPQEVIILSFPTEASVYINGVATGVTPMEIKLPRKLTHEVRLEREGTIQQLNISPLCLMRKQITLFVSV